MFCLVWSNAANVEYLLIYGLIAVFLTAYEVLDHGLQTKYGYLLNVYLAHLYSGTSVSLGSEL